MAAPARVLHQCDPALSPSELQIDVEWRRRPGWRAELSLPRLMRFASLVGQFGGFAGVGHAPEVSSAALRIEEVMDREARWTFHVAATDAGTLGLMTNLLDFSHRVDTPLQSVATRSAQVLDERGPVPLRGHWHELPFEVDLAADSADVYIEIQLAAPPPAAAGRALTALVRSWHGLAAAGAFESGPGLAKAPMLAPEDKPVWARHLLSVRLENATFDDAAFDSLLNCLRTVHVRGMPIAAVEIS